MLKIAKHIVVVHSINHFSLFLKYEHLRNILLEVLAGLIIIFTCRRSGVLFLISMNSNYNMVTNLRMFCTWSAWGKNKKPEGVFQYLTTSSYQLSCQIPKCQLNLAHSFK